jgi:hypothetical protein
LSCVCTYYQIKLFRNCTYFLHIYCKLTYHKLKYPSLFMLSIQRDAPADSLS